MAEHWPSAAGTVMSCGQVATGACVSLTVTVKLQVAWLPAASVAVQVTVVWPTGKLLPLGGSQTMDAPGQLSVTLAV